MERIKTEYPGIYYYEVDRTGGVGKERVFYVIFRRNGIQHEETVGKQYQDNMTAAKANIIRGKLIEGNVPTKRERKQQQEEKKRASLETIEALWTEYSKQRNDDKSYKKDNNRYLKHIKPMFGDKKPEEIIQLDIDRLKRGLAKNRKPQTVKHVLVLLNIICNFGFKKGITKPLSFKI